MIPWFWIGIAGVIFVVDVMAKQLVDENMKYGDEKTFFGGKIKLRKIYNEGAFLGAFSKSVEYLKVASVMAGAALVFQDLVLLLRKKRRFEKLGMMLLTGGAASNVFDRVVRGHVIDYIGFQTKWKTLTKITYNLGDFAIFVGSIIVMIVNVWKKIPRRRKK